MTAKTRAESNSSATAPAAAGAMLPTGPGRHRFDPDASIVLVGCRGAGKRSLGFIGALHLRRRLVTEDHYFGQATGETRAEYLSRHGREVFVRRSAEVFKQMLEANSRRCIIECGMSSLTGEAQEALRRYCASHPVIYVHREREQVLRFLDAADADQLLRADESHRRCSNLEYYNLIESGEHQNQNQKLSTGVSSGRNSPERHSVSRLLCVKEDFTRFLDLLQGQTWQRQWAESPFSLNAVPPEFRSHSFALRLRLSYLLVMDLEWEDYEACGDCVELIIDRWPDDLFNLVARQVALIRRKLAMPIIFHVEEKPRGERDRTLAERDHMDAELLELGLRLNVEYISLDLQRSDELVQRILAQRGRTAVMGNFWFPGLEAPPWSSDVHLHNYERAMALGCSIVRIVRFNRGGGSGGEPSGSSADFTARLDVLVPDPKPLLVAFDYSILGMCTPSRNRIFVPVKHPSSVGHGDHLATVTTMASLFSYMFRERRLDALDFFTVGSHIDYSITPAVNTAAFAFAGLWHTFRAAQCSTLDELNRLFLSLGTRANTTFGGATLAAPFKVAILPYVKLQSQHAAALGAVNVILPLRGRSAAVLDHANARNRGGSCSEFYGDNTDWRSIYICLQRAISPRNVVQPSRTTGLVIGAGGMARAAIYALIQLGCRHIFIYNRTRQHALDVARHFDDWAQGLALAGAGAAANGSSDKAHRQICHVLNSVDDPWPPEYQPPTMVVSCVPAVNSDGSPKADFRMPKQWLTSPTGGVVVELAYEHLVTPLVAQMQALGDSASPAWVVVDGLEIVSEMAIESFELMTGRMAPQRVMKAVCRRAWQEQQRRRALPAP
ncbi:repressor protein [Grosmannia clavigera kw1407]|uniref:Repressor protein n=1 Tax=Grosmannia clavigera (strain kw1407 / UAMH 11150) TaxID=655863 RepID=F0XFL9_GROCL|nr:repressor protein [Grosmannia clavigera kw1407]EFX04189.1 repressor protein [Grosmannia clavigera kw1407]